MYACKYFKKPVYSLYNVQRLENVELVASLHSEILSRIEGVHRSL